jgi:hypothetical protein
MGTDLNATFAFGINLGYPDEPFEALNWFDERQWVLDKFNCRYVTYGDEVDCGIAIVEIDLTLNSGDPCARIQFGGSGCTFEHDRPLQKDPSWAVEKFENLIEELGFGDPDEPDDALPWEGYDVDLRPGWLLIASNF